jgi:CrcB protein
MIWYIALGSAAGGVLRYLVGGAVQRAWGGGLPLGTFVVNLTGSFLLGILLRVAVHPPSLSPEVRAMLTIGLCGGYTTFSTFSAETVTLLHQGEWRKATGYVLASVLVSLLATVAGFRVGERLG